MEEVLRRRSYRLIAGGAPLVRGIQRHTIVSWSNARIRATESASVRANVAGAPK